MERIPTLWHTGVVTLQKWRSFLAHPVVGLLRCYLARQSVVVVNMLKSWIKRAWNKLISVSKHSTIFLQLSQRKLIAYYLKNARQDTHLTEIVEYNKYLTNAICDSAS